MKKWRFKISLVIIFLVNLSILFKLYYWQVVKKEEFQIKAENQRQFVNKIPAKRGEILTAERLPLVLNQDAYLLFANLKEINDNKDLIAQKITSLIVQEEAIDEEKIGASISAFLKNGEPHLKKVQEKIKELKGKLSRKDLNWIALEPKISEGEKTQIEKFNFKGIGFDKIQDRFYPEASTTAQLLGFVGKNFNGYDTGYFGLEGFYNQELEGQEGKVFGEKDIFGLPILIGSFFKRKPKNGHSLILNLDLGVQKIIETELKKGILTYAAKAGTVIILNPKNGAIIAMSSFPNYEPAKWSNFEGSSYKNPAIADSFEPGSILKPIIMSIALNEGKVKPTTKCDKCAGPRVISGYTIRTFNNQYHPNLTMTQVLENSDNTGMMFVGEHLKAQKIYQYLEKFGFGKTTGIDLQEEMPGNLRPWQDWYEIDRATVTFGQGIAVTALQMITAMSALANEGKIYYPQVVGKIKTDREESIKPEMRIQVIKPQTAKVITEMLVSVCEKSPLHFFKELIPELKNYRIAAKSGTAQIPLSGKYSEEKTIGSVIGYFPADNPQFLIMVKLTEPEVNPWGANTAGPIFFKIIRELIKYYGIPSD